jgi:hypothetical protein
MQHCYDEITGPLAKHCTAVGAIRERVPMDDAGLLREGLLHEWAWYQEDSIRPLIEARGCLSSVHLMEDLYGNQFVIKGAKYAPNDTGRTQRRCLALAREAELLYKVRWGSACEIDMAQRDKCVYVVFEMCSTCTTCCAL